MIRLACYFFAVTVWSGIVAFGVGKPVWAQDELLPPETAFAMDAEIRDDTIVLGWRVAQSYFLYRHRFRFEVLSDGVTLGEASIPRGELKTDEIFGEVESLRGEFDVVVPFVASAAASNQLRVLVTSQGCADLGVCYPPYQRTVELNFQNTGSSTNKLAALENFATAMGGSPEFLDPEVAFRLTSLASDSAAGKLRWQIEPGYYLYRDKLTFSVVDPADLRVGSIDLPAGKTKFDEYFGESVVYYDGLMLEVPIVGQARGPVTLEVGYQGCADAGLCYPPIKKLLTLFGADALAATNVTAVTQTNVGEYSTQDRIAHSLAGGSLAWIALTFFGFGLLLSFTPCVLPMVPILSGLIIGNGDQMTTMRAFTISLVYVLAMALTYTAVGVLAGLFGAGLQATFQNPWVLTGFSLVFVTLAGAMFGFYQLQLPSSWQTKLSMLSNRQSGGTLTGAGVMGFLSALIVGPCVAAPLAGALIYIGQTGDAVLGGFALFALSMGMGAPLLLIGSSAGRLLPKAGPWMEQIKAVFGFILLGVAIYLLSRVLPAQIVLLLWAGLVGAGAVFVGVFRSLDNDAGIWRQGAKAVGVLLLVYAGTLVVGATTGGDDPLRPLARIGQAQTHELGFTRVVDVSTLDAALRKAADEGRVVMLDYYADWCVSCKEMERDTFSDPDVQEILKDTVLLQVDVTDNNEHDKALLARYGLYGPPAILFFDRDGFERRAYRMVGYLGPQAFSEHAKKAQG